MNSEIRIKATDGSGDFNAALFLPETDTAAPAVVVIQEIFGVNKNMRLVCDHLSQAGYIVICPDLFWRLEPGIQLDDRNPKDWEKALGLFNKFDIDLGIEDLKATLAFIRKDERCSGRVGTLGFCLGGKLAYLMATRSDADCNVGYYGVGIEALLDEAANVKNPLLLHIAEKDKFVPLEAQAKIRRVLNEHPHAEVHVYPDVDHAFARVGGENYDRHAAQQANYHTADFLATHLTEGD
jgi:carboxymethylenebutenolidase